MNIKFGNHTIGLNHPTYFIADIAANHDGDMERAKKLIRLAKEAGADAAEFWHGFASQFASSIEKEFTLIVLFAPAEYFKRRRNDP